MSSRSHHKGWAGLTLGLLAVGLAASAAEYTETHDSLDLDVGLTAWSFDTDWMGSDLGVVAGYVRLWGGVGGTVLNIEVNGDGKLTYPDTPENGLLWFQGGASSASQDIGFEFHGQYRIVVFGIDYTGDLPYVPQSDLRLQDSEAFSAYNLGQSVTLEDSIDNQELYVYPIGVSGVFSGDIGVSLDAGDEIIIDFLQLHTDKGDFTSEGQQNPVSVTGDQLSVSEIEEAVGITPSLSFTPNVVLGVTVGPFSYHIDIPTFEIDVPLETLLEPQYTTTPQRSILFGIAPVLSAFAINNGATTTMGRAVILNNTSHNLPTHYMASEDPFFSGAVWAPYSPAPQFMLSNSDGVKEVNLKLMNANGESEILADTIVLDRTAPTVDVLVTTDTRPPLSGTVLSTAAAVAVTVDGQTYSATNHGDGTWTLADNVVNPLDEDVYDVSVMVTDTIGNTLYDTTVDELVVDLTAPTVTVSSLRTNDTTPQLSGSVNDANGIASVNVTVNGHTYPATVVGNTWTASVTYSLPEGTHDVQAVATDLAGNPGSDTTTDELIIDLSAILISVDTLATTDTTPPLSGAIDEPTATITITVDGQTLPATNNGNGTWSLANNALSPLAEGVYDVAASASAPGGRSGADESTDELTIDLSDPVVEIDRLTTNDTTPQLTGEITDASACSITITVDGQTHPATDNGDGTWTLADDTLASLGEGTYEVVATATDAAGNSASDSTLNELTIDTTAPLVGVDSVYTNDTTPELTGFVNDPWAEVLVTVWTQTLPAINLYGQDQWIIPDDNLAALAEGVYDVEVTVTDQAGNIATDSTTYELHVDLTPPTASITCDETTPTSANVPAFSVDFNEEVGTSFDASDVTPTGSLAAGATVQVSGTDPEFTVEVTLANPDADGTIGIAVGTGVTDLAGNPFGGGASALATIENWCGFSAQPQDVQAYMGGSASFSVEAACGQGGLAYQWKWDPGTGGLPIDVGGNSPALNLSGITLASAGEYWCEVTYGGEVHPSSGATLEVALPVTITSQPSNATRLAGESCTFTIAAEGGFGSLHYQWRHNGYPVGDDAPILEIPEVAGGDAGAYACTVWDDGPMLPLSSGEAILTVQLTMPGLGAAGVGLLAIGCALGAAWRLRRRP